MALTTFGAVMGFAADLVGQGEGFYRDAAQRVKDPALRDLLQELAAEEGRNRSILERARREHVTEMILEPISGLHQEEYGIEIEIPHQVQDPDLLKIVLHREEGEMRFFRDCSARLPLPEVAGIFRKITRNKEQNLMRLNGRQPQPL